MGLWWRKDLSFWALGSFMEVVTLSQAANISGIKGIKTWKKGRKGRGIKKKNDYRFIQNPAVNSALTKSPRHIPA